jgi:hypothetical protein
VESTGRKRLASLGAALAIPVGGVWVASHSRGAASGRYAVVVAVVLLVLTARRVDPATAILLVAYSVLANWGPGWLVHKQLIRRSSIDFASS